MRFLGLDYGVKRIGIALSDEGGTLAFPQSVILNDSNALKKIGDVIKVSKVEAIVVGESLDLKNQPNAILAKTEIFIEELKRSFGLPVYKQKEFMTTIEARRPMEGKKDRDYSVNKKSSLKKAPSKDANAAALILQRYLDKINKQKGVS